MTEVLANSPVPGKWESIGELSAELKTGVTGAKTLKLTAAIPSITGLRVAGESRVIIGSEIIRFKTETGTGTEFEILERAAESSTEASHAAGAKVYCVPTVGSLLAALVTLATEQTISALKTFNALALTEGSTAEISGTYNNWEPPSGKSYIDVLGPAGVILTGIKAGKEGQVLLLRVHNAYVALRPENTNSEAPNRFYLTSGEEIEVKEGGEIALIYNGLIKRWCNWPTAIPSKASITAGMLKPNKGEATQPAAVTAENVKLGTTPGVGSPGKVSVGTTNAVARIMRFSIHGNGVLTVFKLPHKLKTEQLLVSVQVGESEEYPAAYISPRAPAPSTPAFVIAPYEENGLEELTMTFTSAPSSETVYFVTVVG